MPSEYDVGLYDVAFYDGSAPITPALQQIVSYMICDTSLIPEWISYFTPDGQELRFLAPWFKLQEDGLGMPPVEYVTTRGPFQHGESVKEYWLKPRVIQMLIRRNARSRSEYQQLRYSLINYMRPNRAPRPTPGRLRKYCADGSVREWFVYPSEGPSFPAGDLGQWDQWSIQDTIRFTAYDPIARDPSTHSITFAATGTVGTFPITFPLQIAAFGTSAPTDYAGTWDTFPLITINGPATGVVVRNVTTDEVLSLAYTVPSGRVVTVTLDYGNKTVKLDDGTNLIGYMSADSDIGSFHLQPGSNTFQVYASGTSSISSVILQWYDRYIGV